MAAATLSRSDDDDDTVFVDLLRERERERGCYNKRGCVCGRGELLLLLIGVSSHAMLCTVHCQHLHTTTTTTTSHVKIT